MKKISIVVCCYNEEEALPYLYEELKTLANDMNDNEFEFLFVDDGSKDETLSTIKSMEENDPRVNYVSFSRNFGKEAAIYAGLKNSSGDYVALMDADLQDPPNLLPEMYSYLKNGEYDSVATRRVTRKGEPKIRSFFARRFYKFINRVSKTEFVDGARDYRLMTRQMVDSILSLQEYNRFTKGIFSWVGYKTKWVEFENVERVAGETKWSFFKLLSYSLEGIVAFSTFPLKLASICGVFFSFIAFILLILLFIRALAFGDDVSGWPSLACMILFLGGIQLLTIGILGQYMSKTYLETKKRPIYIAKSCKVNDGK